MLLLALLTFAPATCY